MERFVILEVVAPGIVNEVEQTVTVQLKLMNSLLRLYSCNKYINHFFNEDFDKDRLENVQDLKNVLAVSKAMEEEIKKLEKMFVSSSETSGYKE